MTGSAPQSGPAKPVRAENGRAALGRPRSETADDAILKAAISLLEERGYGAMAVDDIAARAGVGKQTIYRRWASKAAVVLEALTTRAAAELPPPDTGSVFQDVRLFLRETFALLRSGRRQVVVPLMAEAQRDEAFAQAFRERFIAQRRAALIGVIERGVARGQLAACTDAGFLADLLYGPMWYRMLVGHAPIDEAFADRLAAFVLSGGAGAAAEGG